MCFKVSPCLDVPARRCGFVYNAEADSETSKVRRPNHCDPVLD